MSTARFRAKKKQQVISMSCRLLIAVRSDQVPVDIERHISDLTSRAEELEKEALDLRRENGWLKEIVMLKGRTHSGGQLSNFGPHDPPADMGGGGPSRMR
jgi:predicted metal-dependent HD superfamily phosphohydrolase